MRQEHPHICLFRPEIPQNAGSIARLAAATQCRLHLVRPFGFATSDRNLRRPGLDYWPYLDLEIHDSLAEVTSTVRPRRIAFLSKMATRLYTEIPDECDLLIFGQETAGFPDDLHAKYPDDFYRIPIFHPAVRSLNVANAVAVIVYDILRRRGHKHSYEGTP